MKASTKVSWIARHEQLRGKIIDIHDGFEQLYITDPKRFVFLQEFRKVDVA